MNLKVIHPHCVYIITGRKIYTTDTGLRHCTTTREVAGSITDGSLKFSFHIITMALIDSASKGNEYQEHFLGDKGGRCVGLTNLPPSFSKS